MTDILHSYQWLLELLDIGVVAFVVYRATLLLKSSIAIRLLVVLTLVFLAHIGARYAGLQSLSWLLDNLLGSFLLILAIIFQHDIRRALLTFSRNRFARTEEKEEDLGFVDELVDAVEALANRKIGALIVIEREMPLENFLAVGTEIDAKVTSELITSIFLPYSPIHDGAVIIQKGKLTKAGCLLPLTQNPEVSKTFGTRHRAALGLTDILDALVVVVSEETGQISIAVGGRIKVGLELGTLRKELKRLLSSRRQK